MVFTLAIVSEDISYKELFQSHDNVELCLTFDKPSFETTVEVHGILIDGDTISYRELPNVRKLHGDIPIFYKLSGVPSQVITRNIQLVCSGHEIIPISEQYNSEQVVNEVLKHLTGEDNLVSNRLISFFGTHSGSGVSTTVLNVARLLGQRAKEKVLVLSLNPWDPADYFQEYDGHYLNDIKVELKTKNLTEQKLQQYVHKTKYYYHLAGNRDIKLQRFYQTEEIAHLIEVAKNSFDIVLIDGGCHFDNACYAQSFLSSDLKFLITTQETKGYRNYYPLVFHQLLEPIKGTPDDFILLINRYRPNYSLINEKDLQEELEMSLLTSIPDQDVLGPVSVKQNEFLYDTGDDDYKNALETIVNTIIGKANLTRDESEQPIEEAKSFFSNLFGRKKKQEGLVRKYE
ncbi:ParA family protein [Alkalihalobacillus sp. BA299]|uniref:ParA family protein n=1 Tax=Alkalihalobacillus sp. BA299 TaxID=2815938 RepID=UPI001ADBAE8E|nr:ParA family protein [Alkalihalobacillus sp. BA299]